MANNIPDYRSKGSVRAKHGKTIVGNPLNTNAWWFTPKFQAHSDVHQAVTLLKRFWGLRYSEIINHSRRYEDKSFNIYASNPYRKPIGNQVLSLNVTASCIDTLHSKLIKNTPSPFFQPNSSDYKDQKTVKDLQKFIHGHFMYTGAYTRAEQALLDAEIMGTGLVHLVPRNENVMYELIKPYELIFDHEEAGFGDPMDMHIVKLVNRYELIQRFPDRAEDILTAAQYTSVYGLNKVYNNNMILYVESYSRYAKRHVICLNNVTLLDEDWNYEDKYGNVTFPISKIVYKEADRDWLGIGISEELKPIQMELNELIQTARYSCRLMSTPKVFCNRAANIVESQFNDEIGSLIYYDGLTPPTMGQLGQVPVDMYQQVELFYGKAYERVGISQLTASSQLPAGMQQASGKALQTYYQIESDRFQSTGKQYEKFIMDLSDKTIAYMKLMQKNGDISPRQYYDKDDSKNINWGDIDLARDQFDIQTYPVSILPSTPEGKLGVVDYLTQTGMIDTVAAKKLLQLPDTDGYLELENAPIDFVMNHVSMMLKGEEVEPDINQDFDLTLSLVTKAYFYYSLKNVKPVTLTLLENYINAIERIQVKKAAEQQVIMQQAIEAQQNQMQGGIPSGNSEPQSSDGTISGESSGFPATGFGVVE